MKSALWVFIFLCPVAFAQSTPANAAAESLKKRLQELKLVNPPQVANPAPRQVVLQNAPAKTCSAPLLSALPANPSANIVVPQSGGPSTEPDKAPAVSGQPGARILAPNAGANADPYGMPVVKPKFAGQAKDFAVLPAPPCEP
jgi:hypothetical protein